MRPVRPFRMGEVFRQATEATPLSAARDTALRIAEEFGVSVQAAQIHLFVFLGAVAAGTIFGGPVGDRLGRKWVIWASILGVLPFTLALPYVNLFWTGVLSVAIGVILASAFSAIVVFAYFVFPWYFVVGRDVAGLHVVRGDGAAFPGRDVEGPDVLRTRVGVAFAHRARVDARHPEACRLEQIHGVVADQCEVEIARARAVGVERRAVFPAHSSDGASAQHRL